MNKFLISAMTILLVFGCSMNRPNGTYDFIEFVNNNSMSINRDSETIPDKKFIIKIPKDFKEHKVSVNTSFVHVLTFDKNQKVIIIYKPETKKAEDKRSLNLSKSEFLGLVKKLGVSEDIKITPLSDRRFGLKLLGVHNLYAMYFNVRSQEVKTFDYSLESITIK